MTLDKKILRKDFFEDRRYLKLWKSDVELRIFKDEILSTAIG